MPADQRAVFENEMKAARQASQANDLAELLKRQKVAIETAPRVKRLDLAAEDKKESAKKSRKKKDPLANCQVPLPPERWLSNAGAEAAAVGSDVVQRGDRLKEIASQLKSQ